MLNQQQFKEENEKPRDFDCEHCGGTHPGTYHHDESRWTGTRHEPTGRKVYEVVCPKDWMSEFRVPE